MLGGIDQDVGDGRILQQRLQRAQAKDLVQHLVGQPVAFAGAEGHAVLGHQLQNEAQQLLAAARVLHEQQLLQIDFVDQLAMDRRLHFLLRAPSKGLPATGSLQRQTVRREWQWQLQP